MKKETQDKCLYTQWFTPLCIEPIYKSKYCYRHYKIEHKYDVILIPFGIFVIIAMIGAALGAALK